MSFIQSIVLVLVLLPLLSWCQCAITSCQSTPPGYTVASVPSCAASGTQVWNAACPTSGQSCNTGGTTCTFGTDCLTTGCCAPRGSSSSCSGCPSCCRVTNPSFSKQCDVKAHLLLDNSDSLSSYCAGTNGVRAAVKTFVNGLQTVVNVGGSVNLAVTQFDDGARHVFAMQSLTSDYVTVLNSYLSGNNVTTTSSPPAVAAGRGYCTNLGSTAWAAGLLAVREAALANPPQSTPDVVIWFTDGQPTSPETQPACNCNENCYSWTLGSGAARNYFDDLCVNGTGSAATYLHCKSGSTAYPGLSRLASICRPRQGTWAACRAADLVKKMGIKIFLVAVGDVAGWESHMQLVTGKRVWDSQPSTFGNADYVINTDITQLATIFAQTVAGLCACLQAQPGCVAKTGTTSCASTAFDAVVKISTGAKPSSTVWPQFSTLYGQLHYSYAPSPDTRIAFEFFAASQTELTGSPTIVRSDIQNPCLVQRRVACNASSTSCTAVTESKLIPRFFLEDQDALGGCPALPAGVCTSGVTCYTKQYPSPRFVTDPTITPEMIQYLWVFNTANSTPCAAMAGDGTLYEFFASPGSGTRGVTLGTSFNFNPSVVCTQPTCASYVELLFLIDEQSSCSLADYDAMLTFSYGIIQKLLPPLSDLNYANTKFAIRYTASSSTCTGCTLLQSLSPGTAWAPSLSTATYAHTKAGGSSINFAQAMQTQINNIWGALSGSGVKREMLTFVCGPDSSTSSDYTALRGLLATKGIESWVIGLTVGAQNVVPLASLSSSNQYAHYLAIAGPTILSGYTNLEAQLLCPQTSMCGPSCTGLCTCGTGTSLVCQCPQCSATNFCLKSTCPGAKSGCGAPVAPNCDDGDQCTTDSCDSSGGGSCKHVPISCDDSSVCTSDSCSSSVGCLHTPIACTDGNVCTTDTCDSVKGCQYSAPMSCDDGKMCTVDSCDKSAGCTYTPKQCTLPDVCQTGACDSATGSCLYTPISCDDNNACTADSCDSAKGCQHVPITCDDKSACTQDSCDTNTGCKYQTITCDDSSKCTTDSCDSTKGCQYAPIKCSDGNQCTADSCDSTSGCVYSSIAGCTVCGTADCSGAGSPNACQARGCLGCETNDTNCATAQGTCDTIKFSGSFTAAACKTALKNAGTSFYCYLQDISASVCPSDKCGSYTCSSPSGNAVCTPTFTCSDGSACTTDACNPTAGCVYTPTAVANSCKSDKCATRTCNAGTGSCDVVPTTCDDKDACTDDTCNTGTGCVYTQSASAAACVAQSIASCSTFVCAPSTGACTNTFTAVCNDNNVCTDDKCVAGTGCTYTANSVKSACDSTAAADKCNTYVCDKLNGCQIASPIPCNDGDPCTIDSCDSKKPQLCVYTPIVCEQPSACFPSSCVAGTCKQSATSITCTPPDACQTAECRETAGGCVNTNISCSSRTECDIPNGCIITSSGDPQCTVQNITSLIDFCGVCMGNNADCFFSSVLPTSSVAGIAGGVVAGIVIACIIAALIIFFLTKKGYDYYLARSNMATTGLHTNPAFKESNTSGHMVDGA